MPKVTVKNQCHYYSFFYTAAWTLTVTDGVGEGPDVVRVGQIGITGGDDRVLLMWEAGNC